MFTRFSHQIKLEKMKIMKCQCLLKYDPNMQVNKNSSVVLYFVRISCLSQKVEHHKSLKSSN